MAKRATIEGNVNKWREVTEGWRASFLSGVLRLYTKAGIYLLVLLA